MDEIVFCHFVRLRHVSHSESVGLATNQWITVIAEALNRAQLMASECEKEFIYLTYDLAIAEIALNVQATPSPQYKNMFVNLGVVHIKMAFFSTLGCIVQ